MASKKEGLAFTVVWFRKCLRLHDNAALVEASKLGLPVFPMFIIDPHFASPARVGVNRYNFLLESLADLDAQLRAKYKNRLFVVRGAPETVLGKMLRTGEPLMSQPPRHLLWEHDTEPYALARDARVAAAAAENGVDARHFSGHTLWDVSEGLRHNKGKPPMTMPVMVSLAKLLGEPLAPLPLPLELKPSGSLAPEKFLVPSLEEIGYTPPSQHCGLVGGETAGLDRLSKKLEDSTYICSFEKPKTRSTAFDPPSTTQLAPYLKFGCVSVRTFYAGLKRVYAGKKHSEPPTSLLGQLYFREMSYLMGSSIQNFDRQLGNPCCKQIPWEKDSNLLNAWEHGSTGFPFIDACMRQLVRTGWMHHLARHAVSCFLTRGDLWISWEEGRDVFDKYLLDSDWAINNMNWLALAGVAPWSPPFFRVYNPVPKMDSSLTVQDPDGHFIREFVPELRQMPSAYIYAPWEAPLEVQRKAGCVVGKDYPMPVVNHSEASKKNLALFKSASAAGKAASVDKTSGPAKAATETKAPNSAKAAVKKADVSAGKRASKRKPSSDTATTPLKKRKS